MVAKLALLSNLFLASAALAVPSSRLGARLARRRENRQSQPINRVETLARTISNVTYSSNWAGAILDQPNGTFTFVTGTFTVPAPSGSTGAAAAWVGIDGDACANAILQTGVDFAIQDDVVSYDAWYHWYPDYAYDFSGITINPGDVIQTTVIAYSTTSGIAIIENLTTCVTVSRELSSSYALCKENAEWIVEDLGENGSLVPFPDFGTVTFNCATATDSCGYTYTPENATTADIKQNGQVLTSVSTGYETATVQYV